MIHESTWARLSIVVALVGAIAPPGLAGQGTDISRERGRFAQLDSARSSISRIASGDCVATRTVNVRYEILYAFGHDVAVQTTEDVVHASCREGEEGQVSVRSWAVGDTLVPQSHFESNGSIGRVTGTDDLRFAGAGHLEQLYGITEFGCCGSNDITSYFNLRSGRRVFRASAPISWFIANGTVRYVAVLADPDSEDVHPRGRTVALVEMGRGSEAPQVVRIMGDSNSYYSVAGVRFTGTMAGRTQGHPVLSGPCCSHTDTVAVSGLVLRFELNPQSDESQLSVAIPIVGDRLAHPIITRRP